MLSLRSRLREMREDVSDVEFCSQVLESLPEETFGSVITAILLTPKDQIGWEKMRTDVHFGTEFVGKMVKLRMSLW
jgi:hypothetical protein